MDGGGDNQKQVVQVMDAEAGGAFKMGGDDGQGIGGRGGMAIGGDIGGVGVPSGGGYGGEAVNRPFNFSGGFRQVDLGVGSGGVSRLGGMWGQGQTQFGDNAGTGWWSQAQPVVQDWNGYWNQVVNYSYFNGYQSPFPNYGTSSLLQGPQQMSSHGAVAAEAPPLPPPSVGKKDAKKVSRKVFIGGLPPDISEAEIIESFRKFGPVVVDWPRKYRTAAYFPPKGFAYLLFESETSVKQLIDGCVQGAAQKLIYYVDSPTIKCKAVEVRPWRLADASYWLRKGTTPENLGETRMVFVGGVPRELKASALARSIDRIFGGVISAAINVDATYKYPEGCGRVCFTTKEGYDRAVGQKYVWLRFAGKQKKVEMKPFLRTL